MHGRGSPSVDREELHKLTPLQMLAMSKCVDWCNATTGQVTVNQVMDYMDRGPPPPLPGESETADQRKRNKHDPCPDLPVELQCVIPRQSALYLLRHHLDLEHKYRKKKGREPFS